MPDVYVVPRSHLYLVRRAILEEQSRIASGFYDAGFMADKLDGDAVITIHDSANPDAEEVMAGIVRAVLADRVLRANHPTENSA